MSDGHDSFISPFSWRYGSPEMRAIWSERHKRLLMRQVWLALATAQHSAGLVSAEQLADLKQHARQVDMQRAAKIERDIGHDVMAEIRVYAEQCSVGGGIIHWGATSADITDNVDVLRLRQALDLTVQRLAALLEQLAKRIEATAHVAIMGHTHIQPAEPTTLGYRLAGYAQDLLDGLVNARNLAGGLSGKGFKGAVGTQASFSEMLRGTGRTAEELEAEAMAILDLPYYTIASQTYTRVQDLRVLHALAEIAATLHKFALDQRILQSPPFGEWTEPFGKRQVGSTAMPFKRNPVLAENICSLARYVAALPAVAWNNASQTILERSLDDSANRRVVHAEAFLALDEMLGKATRIVGEMAFNTRAIADNLAKYGSFAAAERVLMALVAAGADRQLAHDWIREESLVAWESVGRGEPNPLLEQLKSNQRIGQYLAAEAIEELMSAGEYTGTAASRALAFTRRLRESIT